MAVQLPSRQQQASLRADFHSWRVKTIPLSDSFLTLSHCLVILGRRRIGKTGSHRRSSGAGTFGMKWGLLGRKQLGVSLTSDNRGGGDAWPCHSAMESLTAGRFALPLTLTSTGQASQPGKKGNEKMKRKKHRDSGQQEAVEKKKRRKHETK